jgi:ribosomal protein L11 methyltransferase
VIDYGCGSGILAIASKKMGAKRVIATDIDKQAIEATNNNMLVNDVNIDIMLPNQLKSQANIVIANILVNPLIQLANILSDLTINTLILSGILNNQVDDILCVYQKWFDIKVANSKDEWILLQCQKK